MGPDQAGRFLVIVATPEVLGSCDGPWSAGSGTTDGEAGAVRAADRARHVERGGVPDRGSQSEDRLPDALAAMDAGTLFSRAEHGALIKSAIALHFARSKATQVLHARVWAQTVRQGRVR
jgi:hypothetical protein